MPESPECSECGKALNRYSPGKRCGSCAWEARARVGEPPALPGDFWAESPMREALARRDLQTVLRIYLEVTGLTQEAVGFLINTQQANVSRIYRGNRKRYSIEDVESFRDGLRIPGQLLGLRPGRHEVAAGIPLGTERDLSEATAERPDETFGEALRRLMGERGFGVRALALEVPCDPSHISKLCLGHKRPSERTARRLDEILGADGALVALKPEPPEPQNYPKGQGEATAGTVTIVINPDTWDGDMERRVLLQLAALGISAGTLGTERLGRLVDLVLTASPRDLDDWYLTCDDHLHALRTRPPQDAREDLVIDLLALDRQLDAADAGERIELKRVQAALATLHANLLTRLGDHGSAIRWWRTAKAAADVTGDLELRLGVRATEAGHGLYGQRDPATVLRLAEQAQRIAGRSPRKALLTYTEAKALTRLGRHSDARGALDAFRRTAETAPAPRGLMAEYWNNFQPDWAELQVFAAIGDEAKANRAAEHNLTRLTDRQYAPMIHLHLAMCIVVNGGTDTGARQATEILAGLPPVQRSHMILETGKTVLRAVPIEGRDRPAVRDLRALTA